MTSPKTLGAQLLALESLSKPFHKEPAAGPLERAMRRQAVERFFQDAKTLIEQSVAAGKRPAPIELRRHARGPIDASAAAAALDAYQWPHDCPDIPAKNIYRDIWDRFKSWAETQELEVFFTPDHDGMGQESWYSLNVRASKKVFAKQLDLAEGSVVVPKDMLQQFGSVQAYVEHLQKVAGSRA